MKGKKKLALFDKKIEGNAVGADLVGVFDV